MAVSRATGASGDAQSPMPASGVGLEDAGPPLGDTALRERLRDALLHERWGRDDKQWAEHDRHSYHGECGICQGDVDAIMRLVLPVVEAWAAEQSKHVRQQRDSLLADLKKAERTLAAVEQICRTAIIPPIAEPEARLARRILARIEQPAGGGAAAPTLRQRAEQAERERHKACAAVQRVRDLAEKLAGLAPVDDWGDDMPDTVAADVARRLLAALDRPEAT